MRGKAGSEMTSVRHRRAGFTLVELLVVVSIISLLMAVMLPTLTRAQRQAEGVHCQANQRDLTLAWIQFAMDHDDALCRPLSYTRTMKDYIPMTETLTCKIADEGSDRVCYGISNTMGGMVRDQVRPYRELSMIQGSSSRMVFTDIEPGNRVMIHGSFWPLLRQESDNQGMVVAGGSTESQSRWIWRPWSWPPSVMLQSITARHDNGANMSFADGHVEWRRWRDSRTLGLITGRIADPLDASNDNADLDFLVSILVPPSKKSVGDSPDDATNP